MNRSLRRRPTQCLAVDDDRYCLVVGDRVIGFSDEGRSRPSSVTSHAVPTRPLVAATDGRGRLFVGDYTGSRHPDRARIHVSGDCGRSWQTLAELRGVRHIHGLHWDGAGRLWITTGDDDSESGIWRWSPTDGLEAVLRGSQLDRVVQMAELRDGFIFGTDAPALEENHVFFYDPSTGVRTRIAAADAPVYFAASCSDIAVLTTAAEPTSVGARTACKVLVLRDRAVVDELVMPIDRLPIRAFGYGVVRCDAIDGGRFLLRHYGTVFDGQSQLIEVGPTTSEP